MPLPVPTPLAFNGREAVVDPDPFRGDGVASRVPDAGARVTIKGEPDSDGDLYVEWSGGDGYAHHSCLTLVDEAPAGTDYGIRLIGNTVIGNTIARDEVRTFDGTVVRTLPAAPAAPTYAQRVQALKDAVDTFKNVRGFHDGLTPEKALTVAAFLLGEAPR